MNDICALVLCDGTPFPGLSFGARVLTVEELVAAHGGDGAETATATGGEPPKNIGEVVFNTAMSGYHEVLTDPSYTGQLVAMTYPHIGNYGCDESWNEVGPGADSEGVVQPAGFVVRSLYSGPVPAGRIALAEFLDRNGTPGITQVDTRRLTLALRDGGSQNGVIVQSDAPGKALSDSELEAVKTIVGTFPSMVGRDLIGAVGARALASINEDGTPHLALLDCGAKANIVRQLVKLGCRITMVPSDVDVSILDDIDPDALFVSNGPGDPAVLGTQIELIRRMVGRIPVLGICLGHQLIAEAIGASTHKMKFGHHGVNHPVRDERTKKVFVTSQNHGFAVEESSLPAGCEVWFRNANDGSVEGLADETRRIRTTQFHPESAPGPLDAQWIFGAFLDVVRKGGT